MTNRYSTPITQYLDAAGEPLAGGKINFYVTGTATRANTYSDLLLTIANQNPVELDAAGRTGDIYIDPAVTYRVVLTDADDVEIWSADNVIDPTAGATAAIAIYPGDPNGNVAGNAGSPGGVGASMVYDSVNDIIYVCTTTGSASDAAWSSQTAGSAGLGAANTFTANQTIKYTDAGALVGPKLILYRDSATPAASDRLGALYYDAEDSAGNQDTYATIEAAIADATSASEDGLLYVRLITAGTLADKVVFSGAAIYPATNLAIDLGLAANRFNVAHLTTIELGHDTDTTIARLSAGDISVEGKRIYRADGTDVALVDGGTGGSNVTQAYANLSWAKVASFSANKNGAVQAVATTSPTKVTFGTEEYDVGSFFASSAWTPPAGTVLLIATVTVSAIFSEEPMVAHIYKNGASKWRFDFTSPSASVNNSMTVTAVDQADGDDYYEVYIESTSDPGYNVSGTTTRTFFQGCML